MFPKPFLSKRLRVTLTHLCSFALFLTPHLFLTVFLSIILFSSSICLPPILIFNRKFRSQDIKLKQWESQSSWIQRGAYQHSTNKKLLSVLEDFYTTLQHPIARFYTKQPKVCSQAPILETLCLSMYSILLRIWKDLFKPSPICISLQ